MDKSQEIFLKRNFAIYCKNSAMRFNKLQKFKRQLSALLSNLQYTIPFSNIDYKSMGVVNQKELQSFLIQFGYFHKPQQISRYFLKYSHEKQVLYYDDFLQALLPHSDYVLLSSQIRKQKYLSERVQDSISVRTCAFVISREISFMTIQHKQMTQVTNNSYKVGAQLWRLLDRNHYNQVGYQQISELYRQLKIPFIKEQWVAFLAWHFSSHMSHLNRDKFMTLLDCHNQRKRATSQCKYDQFVTKQQKMKAGQIQYNRKLHRQDKIKENISLIRSCSQKKISSSQQKIRKAVNITQKTQFSSNKSSILLAEGGTRKTVKKQYVSYSNSRPNACSNLMQRKLLYSKLGYQNPQNLIKYSVQRNE